MCRFQYLCLLIIFFVTLFSTQARAEDAAIPILENYLSKGRMVEYIQDAEAYLTRYPSSNFAPRIALDVSFHAGREHLPVVRLKRVA